MSYQRQDIVDYRLGKSSTTFEEARSLCQKQFWNGAVNRLYYSCFHAVSALLAKNDIVVSTHNGARTEFFRLYIKTGALDKNFSVLYSNLMGKRQESDYGVFHDL